MDQAGLLIPNDVGLNETVRSSRSRIASLSSILGHDSSFNHKSDKLGFRKLAKACSRSLAAWNDNSSRRSKSVDQSEEPTTPPDFEEGSHKVPYPTLLTTRRDKKVPTLDQDWKNYFEQHDNKSKPNFVLAGSSGSDEFDTTKMRGKFSMGRYNEKKSKATTLQTNDNIISFQDDKTPSFKSLENITGRRVVQLKDFTSFVSLKAVLAQISGGPLERIVLHVSKNNIPNSKHQLKNNILELWFLNPHDAESFMEFSASGMFLINGLHYNPQWAPPNSYSSDTYHEEPDQNVRDEMINNGARRCLILKKFVNKKVKSSSRHYPSPRSHLSELNVDEIHADFRSFGEIVEISPVISRKLCVAIHFFNVEASIRAKKLFENKESSFYQKYKEWSLWYGKDLADKPCINI